MPPKPKYFDYPLEQGLRQHTANTLSRDYWYFDYPLEQGLTVQPVH